MDRRLLSATTVTTLKNPLNSAPSEHPFSSFALPHFSDLPFVTSQRAQTPPWDLSQVVATPTFNPINRWNAAPVLALLAQQKGLNI